MILSQSLKNIPKQVMPQTRMKRAKLKFKKKRCSKQHGWAVEPLKVACDGLEMGSCESWPWTGTGNGPGNLGWPEC